MNGNICQQCLSKLQKHHTQSVDVSFLLAKKNKLPQQFCDIFCTLFTTRNSQVLVQMFLRQAKTGQRCGNEPGFYYNDTKLGNLFCSFGFLVLNVLSFRHSKLEGGRVGGDCFKLKRFSSITLLSFIARQSHSYPHNGYFKHGSIRTSQT